MKAQRLSDEALVLSCQQGEKQSWYEFWDRFSDIIFSFAHRILSFDYDDARQFFDFFRDKLYQDLLLSSYTSNIPFRIWLFMMLRNTFIRFLELTQRRELYNGRDIPAPAFSLIAELRDFSDQDRKQFPNCSWLLQLEEAFLSLRPLEILGIKIHLFYYFQFTKDDLELLSRKSGIEPLNLLKELDRMRTELFEKNQSLDNIEKNERNIFIKTLHLESQQYHLLSHLEQLEKDHNFDVRLIDDLYSRRKDLDQQISKMSADFNIEQYSQQLIIGDPEQCARLLGYRSGESYSNKVAKSLLHLEKHFSDESSTSLQTWLRFLAIEEKLGMIASPRSKECLSLNEIYDFINGERDEQGQTLETKRQQHSEQCSHCLSLIQLIQECNLEYNRDGLQKKTVVPRDLVSQAKKAVKKTHLRKPSVFLLFSHGELYLAKSNLDTSMDGFSARSTTFFSPNNGNDDLTFFHRKSDILFRFNFAPDKQGFRMEAMGITAEQELFPGIFILVNEDGEIISREAADQSIRFNTLKPGSYSLAVLLPAKNSVAEIENIHIAVLPAH